MPKYLAVFAIPFAFFSALHSAHAQSESLQTRIADILAPTSAGESYRVLSTLDGRVYDVDAKQAELIQRIQKARSTGTPIRLVLESDHVVAIAELSPGEKAEYSDELATSDVESFDVESRLGLESFRAPHSGVTGYVPTQLATVAETADIYNNLEVLNSRSQCYQRAHLWSLQMWNQRGIRSMKVFLFFTRRFIREYRYKWWFHVAPFVYAGGQETVLDPTFTDTPLEMGKWTNEFVTSQWPCPEVSTYAQFEDNQEAQHCYTLKMPMYYYQPKDIEALDGGTTITDWRQWDLDHAARARRRGWWPF